MAKNKPGKYTGKRKTPSRRGNRKVEDIKDDMRKGDEMEHKYNDVSWYAKNERMLRDSASFSYNNPVGTRLNMQNYITANTTSLPIVIQDHSSKRVPSVMALDFVPGIGWSDNSSSPANLAAQNIYSYVRYMNSGAKNYDQADIMLYLLAMDSIYMMWNWAKRMYGYAKVYSQVNRTMPAAFAQADHTDIDDLIDNLADYRYQMNSLAAQISSFCVPAVMPLFIRHSWMVTNIYKDSDNDKSQMYMFVPNGYYTYDETGSANGGQLVWNTLTRSSSTLMNMGQIMGMIKGMIDKVAYSEDIGVMSGDILKAYGQDKLFKITPLEPDYQVIPVYNEEVLNQIHNSSCIPMDTDGFNATFNITQDPNSGYLIYKPAVQAIGNEFSLTRAFINMPWDDVTPANTMVGTRLTATLQWNVDKNTSDITAMGSEFVTRRRIFVYNGETIWKSYKFSNSMVLSGTTNPDAMGMITAISNFDWHPLLIVMQPGSTSTTQANWNYVGLLGDITNYTTIESYELQQMHTSALMSEFNVPQIGSF